MPRSENGRRRKRSLSAEERFQIWLQLLTGELSQRGAAEKWNVDPTTIMRIRRVGREGALAALAQSKGAASRGSSRAAETADFAAEQQSRPALLVLLSGHLTRERADVGLNGERTSAPPVRGMTAAVPEIAWNSGSAGGTAALA